MISFRSWRCLRRLALARISIRFMLGVSSTKIGAPLISPMRRASLVRSSSESWADRNTCRGTRASADSSRMTISILLISREKMALAQLARIAALRGKSMLPGDFAETGGAGHDDQLAGVEPAEQAVEIGETGRYAGHHAVGGPDRLDLVERRLKHVGQDREVFADPLLRHVVHSLLGQVDDVVHVAAAHAA